MTVIQLENMADTIALGARIAAQLAPGDVVLFHGDLGAGKTELARAIIRAMMGAEVEVPSPTFTLQQIYETPKGDLYHYDLYRLKDPEEVFELGWEDAIATGIVLVEWPQRLGRMVPKNAKSISLEIISESDMRRAALSGFVEN